MVIHIAHFEKEGLKAAYITATQAFLYIWVGVFTAGMVFLKRSHHRYATVQQLVKPR